jgi:hypothetical protein
MEMVRGNGCRAGRKTYVVETRVKVTPPGHSLSIILCDAFRKKITCTFARYSMRKSILGSTTVVNSLIHHICSRRDTFVPSRYACAFAPIETGYWTQHPINIARYDCYEHAKVGPDVEIKRIS